MANLIFFGESGANQSAFWGESSGESNAQNII